MYRIALNLVGVHVSLLWQVVGATEAHVLKEMSTLGPNAAGLL